MSKFFRRLFTLFVITMFVAFIAVALYVYLVPLPTPNHPQPTRFLDQGGNEIPTVFSQNRIHLTQEEIPLYLCDAFIAIEDYRFRQHFGLDLHGILRALWKNLQAGRIVEGGSTISQQLAKNLFLTPERTLSRKIPEMLLTLQLEINYTKEEILNMYLNQIYFGHGAYGLERAAAVFFGKSARELTLAEGALLAGVPRAPARYSPFLNYDAAISRQHLILERMVELGYISPGQAAAAREEEISLGEQDPPAAPYQYFIDYAIRELQENYPRLAQRLKSGGLTVHTTLVRKYQEIAEEALRAGLPPGTPDEEGINQPQGALVAMDPSTGHIQALVGGRKYQETQFNRATALRQPGSAFKPFVYLAALKNGYTLTDTIMCQEVEFPIPGSQDVYRPTDYGAQPYHNRPLTLREALTISDNVVATILNYNLGPAEGIKCARRLGIESTLKPYLSSALGTSEVTPLELTRAFCPLANGGRRVEPMAISKITDAQGRTILEKKPHLRQVVDPAAAYIITDVLKGVLEPGGTAAGMGWRLNRPAAGKTGTSQDYGNAWFIGYTPHLIAGVWVGNDKSATSLGHTGGSLAAPIWADFMHRALMGSPKSDFPRPQGVVEAEICSQSGLRPGWWCPKDEIRRELFIAGTEPREYCNSHSPFNWNWWKRLSPAQGETNIP